MRILRVALCQIDAVVGDLAGNTDAIIAAIGEAERLGADVAVFPELALCGYPPEDLLLEPEFVATNERYIGEVARATGACAAVVGYVAKDGGLRNAAAVCAEGAVRGVVYKEVLPNYGVFDEQRWFVPASADSPLFSIAGIPVGVAVCEDAWMPAGPIARLARQGAAAVLVANASPFRMTARREREAMLCARAGEVHRPIVYVNLVGGQDELVFDGGSMVIGANGEIHATTAQFRPLIEAVDIPIADETPAPLGPVAEVTAARRDARRPEPPPVVLPLEDEAEVYEALVLGTRDYVEKNSFGEVVVALSGGIDSSLVATIAADAFGADRVHGVAMPSAVSSQGSLDDAAELAGNLGIDFRVIPIKSAYDAMVELLSPSFGGLEEGIAEENLQARVRGMLMMSLSNKLGWLVLTTGNKSETAVGYSTLYGDTAGGFAVIKDVPKLLVYALSRYRNKKAGKSLIPEAVLTKPPSAELRPNQRDDDTLPPYDVLDPILEAYVEHHRSVEELVAEGYDRTTVERIFDLVDTAEYKRRQQPPGPRVTSRGFGKDRRMPITNRFRLSRPTR